MRRAGDVINCQPINRSVVETVRTAAEQLPDEDSFSPVIGSASPPDPRIPHLLDQIIPTLEEDVIPMAEN